MSHRLTTLMINRKKLPLKMITENGENEANEANAGNMEIEENADISVRQALPALLEHQALSALQDPQEVMLVFQALLAPQDRQDPLEPRGLQELE